MKPITSSLMRGVAKRRSFLMAELVEMMRCSSLFLTGVLLQESERLFLLMVHLTAMPLLFLPLERRAMVQLLALNICESNLASRDVRSVKS